MDCAGLPSVDDGGRSSPRRPRLEHPDDASLVSAAHALRRSVRAAIDVRVRHNATWQRSGRLAGLRAVVCGTSVKTQRTRSDDGLAASCATSSSSCNFTFGHGWAQRAELRRTPRWLYYLRTELACAGRGARSTRAGCLRCFGSCSLIAANVCLGIRRSSALCCADPLARSSSDAWAPVDEPVATICLHASVQLRAFLLDGHGADALNLSCVAHKIVHFAARCSDPTKRGFAAS